jgi:nucleoside-diphosphate-sugar epimerase
MHLVIGRDGLVGSALMAQLAERGLPHIGTTRRNRLDAQYLDLSEPLPAEMMPLWSGVVYLVAAKPNFQGARCDPDAWVVNVDAPIAIARHYRTQSSGVFIVYISSDAMEWEYGTALAVQKMQVESYMQTIDAAIIRPARIGKDRAHEFADFVIGTALAKRAGVSRWEATVNPVTRPQLKEVVSR